MEFSFFLVSFFVTFFVDFWRNSWILYDTANFGVLRAWCLGASFCVRLSCGNSVKRRGHANDTLEFCFRADFSRLFWLWNCCSGNFGYYHPQYNGLKSVYCRMRDRRPCVVVQFLSLILICAQIKNKMNDMTQIRIDEDEIKKWVNESMKSWNGYTSPSLICSWSVQRCRCTPVLGSAPKAPFTQVHIIYYILHIIYIL